MRKLIASQLVLLRHAGLLVSDDTVWSPAAARAMLAYTTMPEAVPAVARQTPFQPTDVIPHALEWRGEGVDLELVRRRSVDRLPSKPAEVEAPANPIVEPVSEPVPELVAEPVAHGSEPVDVPEVLDETAPVDESIPAEVVAPTVSKPVDLDNLLRASKKRA